MRHSARPRLHGWNRRREHVELVFVFLLIIVFVILLFVIIERSNQRVIAWLLGGARFVSGRVFVQRQLVEQRGELDVRRGHQQRGSIEQRGVAGQQLHQRAFVEQRSNL